MDEGDSSAVGCQDAAAIRIDDRFDPRLALWVGVFCERVRVTGHMAIRETRLLESDTRPVDVRVAVVRSRPKSDQLSPDQSSRQVSLAESLPERSQTPADGLTPSDLTLTRQLTLANFVTTASLVAGLAALFETTRTGLGMPDSRVLFVFGLIVVAAVLDAVDGPLARYRDTTGVFGGTLDSLADIVSFGVAPSMVAYFSALDKIPVAGALVCVSFCTCAAWRLARFQVCGHSDWFVGCPVPLAAVIVGLVAALDPSAVGTLLALAVLSWLMVGSLPFPTWSIVRSVTQRRRVPEPAETSAMAQSMMPVVGGIAEGDTRR